VPPRECQLKEYKEFLAGNIIQDNNILQASKQHWGKVISMLKTQHRIEFSGGLQSSLITDEIADDVRSLRVHQIFFACDNKASLKPLITAIKKLQMSIQKIRCYVLIAFGDETLSEARERLEDVYHAGALPFAQLYQPPDKLIKYSKGWRDLVRTFSRPAAIITEMKKGK